MITHVVSSLLAIGQATGRSSVAVVLLFLIPIIPQETPGGNLGVGIAWQQGKNYASESVELLQPAVWMDWRYDGAPDDPRYLPMVFTLADNEYSRQAIAQAQTDKRLWLIGNEPDLEHGYTYTEPAQAAEFSRLWVTETDVPWACCGVIVWPTEWKPEFNWQTWSDDYLANNGETPDVWMIHIYGVNVAQWYAQVESFRAWAQANDVDRPIIVSETAIEWSTAKYNVALLDEIVRRLDSDPMLHSVLWYSVHDYFGLWPTTDLRTATGELTQLGQRFVEHSIRATNDMPILMMQVYLPMVRD